MKVKLDYGTAQKIVGHLRQRTFQIEENIALFKDVETGAGKLVANEKAKQYMIDNAQYQLNEVQEIMVEIHDAIEELDNEY
jgi:hypothetical protein